MLLGLLVGFLVGLAIATLFAVAVVGDVDGC
jgi:hypothetical protein